MKLSKDDLIAEGRTAEVYAWQDGRVLKLFHSWCTPNWIDQEIANSRAVSAMSLSTPKFLGVFDIDGRRGIVYERVDGYSLLHLMRSNPWSLRRYARLLAELHTEIHSHTAPDLVSLREMLEHDVQQCDPLPPDLKAAILRRLGDLPEGEALCHFDFHPDQVLITADGPTIIDWMTARQGHPLGDVARTAVILKVGQPPNASWIQRTILSLSRRLLYRTYLSRYLQLNPGFTYKDIQRWMIPVAAGRLREDIPGEKPVLLDLIRSYHSTV